MMLTEECPTIIDMETLMLEISRYLAAVELFRALGSRPHWRREGSGVPWFVDWIGDE